VFNPSLYLQVDTGVCREMVGYCHCKQKLCHSKWQASWAKMASPGGKLTALAYHPTKNESKAEDLT
jgi:hypothetical protein